MIDDFSMEGTFFFSWLSAFIALMINIFIMIFYFKRIHDLSKFSSKNLNISNKWLHSIERIMRAYRNNKSNLESILNEEYLIAEDYAKNERD